MEADTPIIVHREGSEAAMPPANPLADLLLTIERDDKIVEYLSHPPMSPECRDVLAKIEADFVKCVEEMPRLMLRRRIRPVLEVEEQYGLPRGSLKGN